MNKQVLYKSVNVVKKNPEKTVLYGVATLCVLLFVVLVCAFAGPFSVQNAFAVNYPIVSSFL